MDNNWLSKYRKNITSQKGEDGVLEKILEILKIESDWCVDVGANGKHNSNVYSLMMKGWAGVFIEMIEKNIDHLKEMYKNNLAFCISESVQPSGEKSLDNLLSGTVRKEFALLNIDIDGNDYYIWESLKEYSPIIVIIEFNPTKKFEDYLQPIDGLGGASLSMMIKLGKKKGYELIATTNFNAFFVKKELFDKFGIKDNSIHNMWVENNSLYGRQK